MAKGQSSQKQFWQQTWFKQAIVTGFISLIGLIIVNLVFNMYGTETKVMLSAILGDNFVRWGFGVGGFAVASDLFFHFILRK